MTAEKVMAKTVEHETNLFCYQRGFKARDLSQHPYADDLVLMTCIKDEFWQYLTPSQKGWFNGVWGYVYRVRRPLKTKHLVELEHITIRAKQAVDRQNNQKSRIKQLRQSV
jgi:hypothetical protein